MQTFWNETHPLTPVADKLHKLVPVAGSVPSATYKNKKLEKFRKATNAYWDIFNNGGFNRARSIAKIFGINVNDFRRGEFHANAGQVEWGYIHEVVEPIMAKIVTEAYKEQRSLFAVENMEECFDKYKEAAGK